MTYHIDPKASGRKLRALRGHRSQQEVAEVIGVKQNSLHMYEAGERTPRDKIKIKLCAYYNVGLLDLFFFTNQEPSSQTGYTTEEFKEN